MRIRAPFYNAETGGSSAMASNGNTSTSPGAAGDKAQTTPNRKSEVKFVSKCHNQVLVMIPNRTKIIDGIMEPTPGKRIEFVRFEYETADPKEISWLRKHRLNGMAFTEAAD